MIQDKIYLLIYEDKQGNELKAEKIYAYNITEARKIRNNIFANCSINDCIKIKIKLLCRK